jgi:hydrophobe/amphiphile efflux-1 (HAE1) family protein
VAKFFIERPMLAIVLSIFIMLGGLIAASNLPIAQYPQIVPPQINVSTSYTGANAEVVEQSVAQLVEMQVNGVEDMVAMESTSSDIGSYSLDVKFQLGKNDDVASMQIQNMVSQANAQLPQEVLQSGIKTRKTSPDTILYFSLWSPKGTYDNMFLKNFASIYIIEDIKRIKGVGNIKDFGADFGMRIWLQPDKMAKLGITLNDISAAIQEQNIQAPAGTIGQQPSLTEQEFQYTVRVKGRLTEVEEFKNIIVQSTPDGSFVRISDVAKVELGGKDYFFSSTLNGHNSGTFGIQLTSDANALDTVANIRNVIEKASVRFPQDLEYKFVVDNTMFVRESLREVIKTFIESILIVLLIVFLFLQSWRATLIPMLAVPVSLIGTLGAFLILGFSINVLTLFAMVLAIGIVVDDAIVVVEAVEHHMCYNGLNSYEATIRAMQEVSGPVVAIAFVLASAFIPIAFIGGTVGVLYKQFALTIAVSMGLSAIVALSLTPVLCRILLKNHGHRDHGGVLAKGFKGFNGWFERALDGYASCVGKAIRKAKFGVMLLLVLIILTGGLFHLLPSSFVPNEDQGYFVTTVTLPEAASLNRTRVLANNIAESIRYQPGVQDTFVIAGFDVLANGAKKSNSAAIFTALKPWSERAHAELSIGNIMNKVRDSTSNIPEGAVMTFNAPTLPGVGSFGGFKIMLQDKGGGSIEEIDKVTKQFIAVARQRPEVGRIYTTFRTDTPGYRFEVDREKVKRLGIPLHDVFNALQTFLGGGQVNDFNKFGRTYKVVMQAEPQYRADPDATRFFFVRSSTGQMIPLNTLVKPVSVNSPTLITRFNNYRAVQVGGDPAPGYSSGQVLTALEKVADQTLPVGYSYEWAEQSREEKISGKRAPIVFGFALLFIFLCLTAFYESCSIPFAVLLSVPAGVFGSFLFQYMLQLENNIYMQIGLIMLIGLSAKNAILIVEFAKVRVDNGMNPIDSAIEAARLRLRPILMTSLAFILGCFPLIIATGAGAAARKAMGTAVVGGMLMSTAIGIFLIPVLYVVIEHLSRKITSWKQRGNSASIGK